MFRNKLTKILSEPTEEILEVETPVAVEPEWFSVSNIETIAVSKRSTDETGVGTLVGYDGKEYNYTWDIVSKRIISLSGHNEITPLIWDLCNQVLRKFYIKPEAPKVEEPLGPQIEQAINKALKPVEAAIKNLEGKVNRAPAPAPVQSQPVPRPQTVQSAPVERSGLDTDDFSTNAMKFLQESNVPDLGIDYMSL
jgi:hypothetical protein